MASDPTEVARMDAHSDFRRAVPTPDHFIPLLYLAGLAGADGTGTDLLIDGYTYGSLSMTAYTLGMATALDTSTATTTTEPTPAAPPDATNI